MTNFKSKLMMTAVVLACAAPLSAQTNDTHSPADHMKNEATDMKHNTMHGDLMKWDSMTKDEQEAKWKTMSQSEKDMVKEHVAMKDKKAKWKNMSDAEKKMKMESMSDAEKAKMKKHMKSQHMSKDKMDPEWAAMSEDERRMKMESMSDKDKKMIKNGMHPSKVNDTVGEHLQDDAKTGWDKKRAIAVPGSSDTVTTVTCPEGTTAQPDMTCLVTGDYTPK